MKPIHHLWRILLVALAAGLLGACGGGGGDESGGSQNPPPNPPVDTSPLTLSMSSNEISAQSLSMDSAAPIRSLTFTVANPSGADFYVAGGYSNTGIERAALQWLGGYGSLTITFRNPITLAPGTYNDHIDVRACTVSPCTAAAAKTTQTVTVTYVVTVLESSVSFSRSSVTVSADNTSSGAPIEELINITVGSPTAATWVRTATNGALVINAGGALSLPQRTQGTLQILLRPPKSLGAGTYTDSVKVEVCLDAACNYLAGGAPVVIPVTYTVTGTAQPNITVQWVEGAFTGAELNTAETRSPTATLQMVISPQVYEGIHMRHSPSSTGLISGAVLRQIASGSQFNSKNGIYDITLKAPAMLGAGRFTDSMEFEACFDAACTLPVPNSRHTLSVSIFITSASSGNFTRRVVPNLNGATEIVWSAARQALYAAVNFGDDHRIVQIDPVTMATTSSAAMEVGAAHRNLRHMAVSDDGGYLYVGSWYNAYVYRLQLPSLVADAPVPLGDWSSYPRLVYDLAMIPGQPQSFIVAETANNSHAGIFVYDGLVARQDIVPTNPAQAFETPRWLVPSVAPGTFITQSYGQSVPKVNNIDLVTLDANGIHTSSSTPTGHQFGFPKPRRGGDKLYMWNGQILDASSGALLGNLPASAGEVLDVLPVEARGRLFVWTQIQFKYYVLSYDLNSMQLLGSALVDANPVSGQTGTDQHMTAWGSDGIALVGGSIVLLSGPMFGG